MYFSKVFNILMRVWKRVQKKSTAIETNNDDHLRLFDKRCFILKLTERYMIVKVMKYILLYYTNRYWNNI